MAKIINLFAGPGVGKTSTASGLFYELKINNYNVELVNEFAKELAYEKRTDILKSDQLFVLANQHRNLLIKAFEESLDYIIMESPILLSNIYFNDLSIYHGDLFRNLTLDLFSKYNNINFYLNRNSKNNFINTGRIHNEYESRMLDIQILNYLKNNNICFKRFDVDKNIIHNILNFLYSSEQN